MQLGRTLMIFTAGDEHSGTDLVQEIDIIGHDDAGRLAHRQIDQPAAGQPDFRWGIGFGESLAGAGRSNLDVMYHTALAASHTMDIDQLLQRIMELIFEWVEADRGCVMLVDQESQ